MPVFDRRVGFVDRPDAETLLPRRFSVKHGERNAVDHTSKQKLPDFVPRRQSPRPLVTAVRVIALDPDRAAIRRSTFGMNAQLTVAFRTNHYHRFLHRRDLSLSAIRSFQF